MNHFGAMSSTGVLTHVQLIPPSLHPPEAYQEAGWLPHDPNAAQKQFQNYVNLLAEQGIEVTIAPEAPPENPDAIYAYDNALVLPQGAIIFRSCKMNRRGEWKQSIISLKALDIPILAQIEAPGTIDGGDVFWLDSRTLAVGLSWRTNEAAIQQLQQILDPIGIHIEAFDLPNVYGKTECLHLMSLISPLHANLAVIEPRYMPVRLLKALAARDIKTIHANHDEFNTLATNVLAIGNHKVIALSPNPKTHRLMTQAGLTVIPFDAPDLCVAGTGGPTCLTRIIARMDTANPET